MRSITQPPTPAPQLTAIGTLNCPEPKARHHADCAGRISDICGGRSRCPPKPTRESVAGVVWRHRPSLAASPHLDAGRTCGLVTWRAPCIAARVSAPRRRRPFAISQVRGLARSYPRPDSNRRYRLESAGAVTSRHAGQAAQERRTRQDFCTHSAPSGTPGLALGTPSLSSTGRTRARGARGHRTPARILKLRPLNDVRAIARAILSGRKLPIGSRSWTACGGTPCSSSVAETTRWKEGLRTAAPAEPAVQPSVASAVWSTGMPSSSFSRWMTRLSISSRIGRTAATSWPAGSSSTQSS